MSKMKLKDIVATSFPTTEYEQSKVKGGGAITFNHICSDIPYCSYVYCPATT